MTGPVDPSLTDMFQVLLLLATPVAILLALRYLNRRADRTQRRASGDAVITTAIARMDFKVALLPKLFPSMNRVDTRGYRDQRSGMMDQLR
jgi:hypothetical protein